MAAHAVEPARHRRLRQTFELTESDETLAYAGLDNAVKGNEPGVGFCYTPHYVFVLHDLHILTEPEYDEAGWNVIRPADDPAWLEKSSAGMAWDSAYLHLHYAEELEDGQPEVATMFRNMKLDTETVSAMTCALVVDKVDPLECAEKRVAENEDEVLGWRSE